MSLIIGIDPGCSGCTALLNVNGTFHEQVRHDETWTEVSRFIRRHRKLIVFGAIEKVHSMPMMGIGTMFKFGMTFGLSLGCLISHQIRYEEVPPQTWMKKMKCMTKGNKNVSKAAAERLFGNQVKVTHRNADALLIAEYARRLAVERKLM